MAWPGLCDVEGGTAAHAGAAQKKHRADPDLNEHEWLWRGQVSPNLILFGEWCAATHSLDYSARWCQARAKLARAEFTQAIGDHWRSRVIEWNRLSTAGRS